MGFFDKVAKFLVGNNVDPEEEKAKKNKNIIDSGYDDDASLSEENEHINNPQESCPEDIIEEPEDSNESEDALQKDNIDEDVDPNENELITSPIDDVNSNSKPEDDNIEEPPTEPIDVEPEPKDEPSKGNENSSISDNDASIRPKAKKKSVTATQDDPIQKQDKIMKGILAIAQDYRINKIPIEDKLLRINVSDKITFDILCGSDFIDRAKQDIFDQEGIAFGNGIEILLKKEIAPEWTKIYPDVYIEISSCGKELPPEIPKKASLEIIANSGSLLKDRYILSSEEIKTLPQKRYNIGIGAKIIKDHRLRTNQIAIDDNPNSPFFEYNKYGSRAHAYISYDEQHGFLLYVERGGTSLGGKRTRVYRTGTEIKLENPIIPEPLCDGDVIELTKKVQLLFNEIKD